MSFLIITIMAVMMNVAESAENATVVCNYGTVLLTSNVCEECGSADATSNAKIVGGAAAVPYSWPAQVLIILTYKTDYTFSTYGSGTASVRFKCGGTLINKKTVLTAGHCRARSFTVRQFGLTWTVPITTNSYYPTFESMFKVYVGAYDVTSIENGSGAIYPAVEMSVNKVKVHPSFNPVNLQNDIMLLVLSSPVTLNSYVKLACLPKEKSSSSPSINQDSFASGWGTLSEGGSSSKTLQNVKLTVYDTDYCNSIVPTNSKNWDRQMCSGDLNGKKDTCKGDSGGGLYVFDSTVKKYIVAGITSYGEGCAREGSPGVYTRVSFYVDWIKENWETGSSSSSSSSMIQSSIYLTTFFLFVKLFV